MFLPSPMCTSYSRDSRLASPESSFSRRPARRIRGFRTAPGYGPAPRCVRIFAGRVTTIGEGRAGPPRLKKAPGFHELGLSEPLLLAGSDLLGQAQTGTGKTAAFALPVLAQIDLRLASPQALVLVPTREFAIQVAETFRRYSAHLKGFHVLPIHGG